MNKPTLFSYFRSSASYRVRIALHLKKVDFHYKGIHLVNNGGEQNQGDYKTLNPMAQVPSWVEEGHPPLTQSMAILQYLDEKYPEPNLFPKDPFQKAKVLELCEIINSGIQPLHNLSVLQKLEKDFGADQDKKDQWSSHWVRKGLNATEELLKKSSSKYCFGDTITAADACLVPQIFGAERVGVSPKEFQHINKVFENCLELEAFKKAHPLNQPDTPNL